MGKRKVEVMECDNPTCDSKPQVHTEVEPALGYHFKGGAYHLGWGGGGIPPFFACKPKCIVPAMEHVIEQGRN